MSITYHIDKINKIVFVDATGVLTAEDIRIHRRRVVNDPDFDPHDGLLFDLRSITEFRISSTEIRMFATEYISHERARRAYLVPTEEVYGMVRMYSLIGDFESDVAQVFYDMAEARRWLGLD